MFKSHEWPTGEWTKYYLETKQHKLKQFGAMHALDFFCMESQLFIIL